MIPPEFSMPNELGPTPFLKAPFLKAPFLKNAQDHRSSRLRSYRYGAIPQTGCASGLNLKSTLTNPKSRRRSGISLFEVLISMLVASIGVLGVLVLIPFAVKVAERGLDQEAAHNHAQNLYADFEAYGYRNTERWVDADELTPPNSVADPGNVALVPGNVYLIDPLRIARAQDISLATTGFPAFTNFPYSNDLSNLFPNELEIRRISVRDQTRDRLDPADANYQDANNLPLSMARRIFTAPDDLNLDDTPASDLLGPTQLYFEDGSGNYVKRQYRGSISSMMFTIPDRSNPGQWIMYTLVFKDRNYDPNDFLVSPPLGPIYDPNPLLGMPAPVGQPRVFEVVYPPPVPPPPFPYVGYGGGDLALDELNLPPVQDADIRSGDWMMLINGHFDPLFPPGTGPQNIQNLNFYRVIEWVPPTPSEPQRVTLVGPDFIFTNTTPTTPEDTATYAILIPNVIAVFERTIRPESRSNYN